jgi:predicted site-specific integrase-resolvase
MQQKHCPNQKELARRWTISHRTLERWRWAGEGPAYMKIGGRVVYRLEDIVAFERGQIQDTVDAQPRAGAA